MTRRLVAVFAALITAVAGALLVVAYTRKADERALAGQQAVNAYVAVKEVPAGTTVDQALKDGLIQKKMIARNAVPAEAVTEVNAGDGVNVATSVIRPGEMVLQGRFAAPASANGVISVPVGKVAVSVALEDPAHVGPFVTVGSMVAVMDTFNIAGVPAGSDPDQATATTGPATNSPAAAEPAAGEETPAGSRLQDRHEYRRATRILLPSVTVLAVGATTTGQSEEPESGQSAGGTTLFTLAVNQDEALRLIHAARTGTLSFALLGPEASLQAGAGIEDRSLFGGQS